MKISLKIFLVLSILLFPVFSYSQLNISFDKYHDYEDIRKFLDDAKSKYSKICKVYSIGKSFKGKDLNLIEITNYDTGKPENKPGIYIDGGTHGNEVTGVEVCLHTIKYLLENYGKEKRITDLIDSRVFYILPSVNPDCNDLMVNTPRRILRNNLKPYDDDEDGSIDEDPEEDIDGDGFIVQMRKKDPEGKWIVDEKDQRIMKRADKEKGEKGEYKLYYCEGIDNDGDGKINEDPEGGVNINRNYPAGWELEYKQPRGGTYPLSESEAKAIVEFFIKHRNIAVAQSYHTSGAFLYRPFAHLSDSKIPKRDKEYWDKFGKKYKKITRNPIKHPYHEKGEHKGPYGYGIFIDWAYGHFGIFAFTTELWKIPEDTTRKEKEKSDRDRQIELLEWNEKELNGEGFINWKPFDHPTLGKIEIGGWKKFTRSNPPPGRYLKQICIKNTKFDIAIAEMTPFLEITDVKIRPVQTAKNTSGLNVKKDGTKFTFSKNKNKNGRRTIFEIIYKVINSGKTDINTAWALKNDGAKDLRFEISLDENSELVTGKPLQKIKNLRPEEEKEVKWLILMNGNKTTIGFKGISLKGGNVFHKTSVKF